jgi:hypothetical protein
MTLKMVKIESAMKECDSHLQKLHYVYDKIGKTFPLSEQSFVKLSDEIITFLDQFLYRFMKLQDAMGMKMFPAMADMISGQDEARPFIDTLNILEKNGIIDSVSIWQEFRNIRNTLAHEYPDSVKQTVEAINELFADWKILEQMYLSMKEYYVKRLTLK